MRVKLDENIGNSGVRLLRESGHDVATVFSQQLSGVDDRTLFEICASERRVLITLDRGFGRLVRFPPPASAGVVILETGPVIAQSRILDRLREFLPVAETASLTGGLWIVEPGRIRMHNQEGK